MLRKKKEYRYISICFICYTVQIQTSVPEDMKGNTCTNDRQSFINMNMKFIFDIFVAIVLMTFLFAVI